MTVRIAKMLGLNEILDLSKKMNIYEEIPELLSVSLGAAETSLLNLSSAYASFVNGGIKIDPNLISRIQDRRPKTIFKIEDRTCLGCDKFVNEDSKYPKITNSYKRVFSENCLSDDQYLERCCRKGTAEKLKSLNVPLAGKHWNNK